MENINLEVTELAFCVKSVGSYGGISVQKVRTGFASGPHRVRIGCE